MTSPWANYPDTAPADFAENDVPIEEDHDEPYDRCPFCNSVIAAITAGAIIGGLMLSAMAIKALLGVLS